MKLVNGKKTTTSIYGCGHCKNLNKGDWLSHNVRVCPVLAITTCNHCKKFGHTTSYCSEKDIEPIVAAVVPANCWAKIAKKAMTSQDKVEADAIEAKIKADTVEKKRKEQHAYLERKARREFIAATKKAQDDANYKLYAQHMWYKYGHKWYFNFEEDTRRANEIPEPFYNRVQAEIEEDYRVHYEMTDKAEKEYKKKEAAKSAEKTKMKATLSPQEYREWKDEEWDRVQDELDDWLDRGWCDRMESAWICRQREANGKIWLEEKMRYGEIVLGNDGKYKYFGKVSK
jgi:hypothetical protein